MACTVTTSTLFLHLSSHLISPGGATPDAREQKEKSSVLYYLARGLSDSVLPLSGSLINDLSPMMQMEWKGKAANVTVHIVRLRRTRKTLNSTTE